MGLVDTNVLVVANARDNESPNCVDSCVDCLASFMEEGRKLYLDSHGDILDEYSRYVHYGTPQGVGDAFYVWAVTYQATSEMCRVVSVTPDDEWGYEEFPHVESLKDFDRSDRKFVAVAVASGENPIIFNATDSDWRKSAIPLADFVTVRELCQ